MKRSRMRQYAKGKLENCLMAGFTTTATSVVPTQQGGNPNLYSSHVSVLLSLFSNQFARNRCDPVSELEILDGLLGKNDVAHTISLLF